MFVIARSGMDAIAVATHNNSLTGMERETVKEEGAKPVNCECRSNKVLIIVAVLSMITLTNRMSLLLRCLLILLLLLLVARADDDDDT
jgi:hypothetical protein